jgi:hypothetical protein
MMNIRPFHILLIIISLAAPVRATTFFVSPSGDDSKTELSEAEAWGSISNGDEKDLLLPGDTVNILPGTYSITQDSHREPDWFWDNF